MKAGDEFEKRINDTKILRGLTIAFILITYSLVFLKVLFW